LHHYCVHPLEENKILPQGKKKCSVNLSRKHFLGSEIISMSETGESALSYILEHNCQSYKDNEVTSLRIAIVIGNGRRLHQAVTGREPNFNYFKSSARPPPRVDGCSERVNDELIVFPSLETFSIYFSVNRHGRRAYLNKALTPVGSYIIQASFARSLK